MKVMRVGDPGSHRRIARVGVGCSGGLLGSRAANGHDNCFEVLLLDLSQRNLYFCTAIKEQSGI